jgi:hypothetical protein
VASVTESAQPQLLLNPFSRSWALPYSSIISRSSSETEVLTCCKKLQSERFVRVDGIFDCYFAQPARVLDNMNGKVSEPGREEKCIAVTYIDRRRQQRKPGLLLGMLIAGSYSVYLFRGGRFVLRIW